MRGGELEGFGEGEGIACVCEWSMSRMGHLFDSHTHPLSES